MFPKLLLSNAENVFTNAINTLNIKNWLKKFVHCLRFMLTVLDHSGATSLRLITDRHEAWRMEAICLCNLRSTTRQNCHTAKELRCAFQNGINWFIYNKVSHFRQRSSPETWMVAILTTANSPSNNQWIFFLTVRGVWRTCHANNIYYRKNFGEIFTVIHSLWSKDAFPGCVTKSARDGCVVITCSVKFACLTPSTKNVRNLLMVAEWSGFRVSNHKNIPPLELKSRRGNDRFAKAERLRLWAVNPLGQFCLCSNPSNITPLLLITAKWLRR